jgi:uncharacterized phiE125 gp8 family phage protein
MTSTLIAGPGGEPLTLAEAKAWCRIDGDDEDALLTALIAAARLQIESMTERALLTQSWRLAVMAAPGALVRLPVRPVQRVTAATLDGAAVELVAEGDSAKLPDGQGGALVVEYDAGYGAAGDVPADLRQAVLLLTGYWYANRDADVQTLPATLDRLLAGFRQVRL